MVVNILMHNPFKKMKINYLFFGSFALIIVIVVSSIILISYSVSSKEMVSITSSNQQMLLDQFNSEISAQLVMLEQIALSAARDNTTTKFISNTEQTSAFSRLQMFKEVQQSLANLTYAIPIIQGIDLYMNQPFQSELNSYIQFKSLEDMKEQPWYKETLVNDFFWDGKQQIDAFQGKVNVISFVRAIEYNNRIVGYLVLHAKSEMLEKLLAGSSPTGNRMMLNAAGDPLISIGNLPDELTRAEWNEKLKESSGRIRVDWEHGGGPVLVVYSKLPDLQWTMVEITPWSVITAGSLRLAKMIIVIGAIAILLSLLVALLLSRQLISPISKLVSVMNRYVISQQVEELPQDYENEFGYLFNGYRKQMQRIEELYQSLDKHHEQLRKVEIESLQANINPHFLYNTLDQLNWMAISNGQNEMSRILELMGKMFRIGLSNGESFITVGEEVEHITSYLEIQLIRFGEGLTYEIDVRSQVRGLFMPKMVLQPFVENSVVHGLHQRESGHIRLAAFIEGEHLTLTIEDDGTGLKGEQQLHIPKKSTGGYGIRNVKERIYTHFGSPFGVEINNRSEGGTIVKVTLPLLKEKP